MFSFLICIGFLIAGYFIYGKFVEKQFGADPSKPTPATTSNDGVDYIPLPLWKIFMIQLLNISGLGPIFGAILGATYGPMAYIWIVLGCVFMGATHDYLTGMLSIRNNGASLPELVGKYLGNITRNFMRLFTLLLLIFVGVAFVSGPANLLYILTGANITIWIYIIFAYYLIATLLPINKIIGKIYPFFGALLIFMALSIAFVMIYKSATGTIQLHEISFADFKNYNINPDKNFLFPMMFIIISCGAISGFHATQVPLMARCLKNEKYARHSFYGSMIAEGIIALIWATVAMNFFGGVKELNLTLENPNYDPAYIVNEICNTWLGKAGAVLAIIGVIICPITSGDTAFRSARLTVADSFNFNQKKLQNRLIISIPLFIIGFMLTTSLSSEFARIWKFVGISNQILASIVLWTAAMYLALNKKIHWITSVPAFFLTAVCATFIFIAPHANGGLAFSKQTAYPAGIIIAVLIFVVWFFYYRYRMKNIK